MPSLQIRDLPEALYRLLQPRAQAHRSRLWLIWRPSLAAILASAPLIGEFSPEDLIPC